MNKILRVEFELGDDAMAELEAHLDKGDDDLFAEAVEDLLLHEWPGIVGAEIVELHPRNLCNNQGD